MSDGASKWRTISAVAGIVAPALFIGVFSINGLARADYDPFSMYISAGSLGPTGWIQIANFVVLGTLLTVFTLGVRSAFKEGKASKAGPILLFVTSICFFFSGPFVMDPMNTLQASASLHGLIHGILGGIVFLLMPIICFVFYRRFRADSNWRSMSTWTIVAAIVVTIADLVFTVVSKSPSLQQRFAPWLGFLQRSVLIPYMVWLLTFAVGMFARRPKHR